MNGPREPLPVVHNVDQHLSCFVCEMVLLDAIPDHCIQLGVCRRLFHPNDGVGSTMLDVIISRLGDKLHVSRSIKQT
jgi:hypothetical protein